MIVSGVILSYVCPDGIQTQDIRTYPDPENLLEVFLEASIGTDMVLDLGEPVAVHGDDQIGECLLIESSALSHGLSSEAFEPMNALFFETLRGCCGLALEPRLAVLVDEIEILSIGTGSDHSIKEAFASAVELYDEAGQCYLVMLVLTSRAS